MAASSPPTGESEFAINLSTRLSRLPPYLFGKLNNMKSSMRRDGRDVIDLGMGNPNDPTPDLIIDKLCEAVRDPRNHRYSTSAGGLLNLRKEVAKNYQQEWGVEIDPETEVACVIGSKEGFSHLCLALLGPGDTILVPNPAFPVHIYAPALAGANVTSIPLTHPDEFLSKVSELTHNLYPRPKMLVLNYPHNPTTAVVEEGFFEEVVKLARSRGLIVIHDFAYAHTLFDGYQAPSFLQVPGAKEIGVEFTTMSKQYNMAGWRVGFCVGNSHIISALHSIKGYYDYGIFQPVQIASIVALRHCKEFAISQAEVYQNRRDVLCDGLNRIGWNVQKPKATMFVWAQIPERHRSMGSVEFSLKLLEEAEVAVAPGRGFGEEGEGYLRFALVENELRLKQAVRQIGRAFPPSPGDTSTTE